MNSNRNKVTNGQQTTNRRLMRRTTNKVRIKARISNLTTHLLKEGMLYNTRRTLQLNRNNYKVIRDANSTRIRSLSRTLLKGRSITKLSVTISGTRTVQVIRHIGRTRRRLFTITLTRYTISLSSITRNLTLSMFRSSM